MSEDRRGELTRSGQGVPGVIRTRMMHPLARCCTHSRLPGCTLTRRGVVMDTQDDDPTLDLEALEASMADGYTYGENGSVSWSNPYADKIDALGAQIRRHPANKAYERARDLGRVLQVWHRYSRMLTDLLGELENSEEAAVELIRNVGDMSAQESIIVSLDQGLVAYVAGLGAVIDHARLLVKDRSKALQTRYTKRTQKMMADLPHAMFLAKLRNYVLHNVAAPWDFSGNFVSNGLSETKISLSTETLLENASWWNSEAKTYLLANAPKVHLAPLLEPYRVALVEHIETLIREVWEEIDPLLDEVREMNRKRWLLSTGGTTNGDDWEERMAHIQENAAREARGEPALNYQTGKPFTDEESAKVRGAFGQKLAEEDPPPLTGRSDGT